MKQFCLSDTLEFKLPNGVLHQVKGWVGEVVAKYAFEGYLREKHPKAVYVGVGVPRSMYWRLDLVRGGPGIEVLAQKRDVMLSKLGKGSAFPDLVGEVYFKGGEIFYFIEVKTESSRLHPHQKEGLKKAKEVGLVPIIAQVKILDIKDGRFDVSFSEL
ncbi:hypothetical protein ES703_36960 [subsurface metagenome]